MRRVLCVLAVAAMVFALVGCGGGSKYEGKWKLVSASYAGIEVTAEEMGSDVTMELKSGGKASFDFDGEKNEMKWEEKEGKAFLMDEETEEEVPLELKDGKLIIDYAGMNMTFEK